MEEQKQETTVEPQTPQAPQADEKKRVCGRDKKWCWVIAVIAVAVIIVLLAL